MLIIIIVYVDDVLFIGNKEERLENVFNSYQESSKL